MKFYLWIQKKKSITWWQDCPPESALIAKQINSPILAPRNKLKSIGGKQHGYKNLNAGIFPKFKDVVIILVFYFVH